MRLVNAPVLGASRDTGDTIAQNGVPIGVPFWSGIGAIVAALLIGFAGGLLFAIVIAICTGGSPDFTPGHLTDSLFTFVFYGLSGAFAWWALNKLHGGVLHALTRRDVIVALAGVCVVFAVRIIGGLILVALNAGDHVQAGFENFSVATSQPSTTALAAILATVSLVIVAPIVEEVIFRGLLFGALSRPLGIAFAAIVSGLLFGALHGDLIFFPLLAALGIINAVVYARTQNLAVPMIVHAANNAIGALFLIPLALHAH